MKGGIYSLHKGSRSLDRTEKKYLCAVLITLFTAFSPEKERERGGRGSWDGERAEGWMGQLAEVAGRRWGIPLFLSLSLPFSIPASAAVSFIFRDIKMSGGGGGLQEGRRGVAVAAARRQK